jgi:flagellar operon protein
VSDNINIMYRPTPILDGERKSRTPTPSQKDIAQFQQIMQHTIKKNESVKISAHAQERLHERKIHISDSDMVKIEEAVSKAREKGVKSSLVLMGNMALIASVTNSTIITAMDRNALQEHVFTGIDGAVIVE